MSAFKDAIAADIKNVFINTDEFAEEHDINGVMIPCVISDDLTAGANASLEGVFINTLTINVSKDALNEVPVEGELLRVNGSLHIVRSVSDEMGMLVITCEANEQ